MNVDTVMNDLVKRHPGEVEYHQAVREVLESIEEVYNDNPHFRSANIVDRIIEPDFDPKGKSNAEIMRFCQAFMMELWNMIGPDTDVPAGDIGVGGREIGYLYGMYRKLARENTGVLTGKGLNWGGSLVRPEATGFGCVYFAKEMLATRGESFKGKRVAISGFGNVAWGAALKVNELGGKVVTLSGPDGYINEDIVAPYALGGGSGYCPSLCHPE